MNKDEKATQVDEIADRLGDASAVFAVDYRGISVPQAAELRARLREADATFRVVKNRLAKRALERAGANELDPFLEGPTALTFIQGDAVVAAKAIATFGRQNQILEYKGGLMDGAPLAPDQFTVIARLPAVDVLWGQLVGVAASPLTGLTRGLASMLSGLATALGQIHEQGLVGGGAEAEPAPDDDAGEADEADEEPAAEEKAPEEAAKDAPVGASDEVAEQNAQPAAAPEPSSADTGGEAEDVGGVMEEASGGGIQKETESEE